MKLFVFLAGLTLVTAAFAAIATIPTWMLWNWLMPDVFGLPRVSLLESFGLLLLSGLLFGSRHVSFET